MAVHDLRNVPRYLLCTLLGLVILCGLLSLWEARGDGKIPGMSPLQGPDPYCISSAGCVAARTDAETRWQGLSPALVILDQVNPTVAAWVRKNTTAGASSSTTTTGPRANRRPPKASTAGSAADSSSTGNCFVRTTEPSPRSSVTNTGTRGRTWANTPVCAVVPVRERRRSFDHGERRRDLRARGPHGDLRGRPRKRWKLAAWQRLGPTARPIAATRHRALRPWGKSPTCRGSGSNR